MFNICKSFVHAIFMVLFCSIVTFADDAKEARKAEYKAYEGSIPLPRQMSFVGKGMSLGLGLGAIRPLDDQDNPLLAWRGVGEYYYLQFLSAGLEVTIYGGDVTDDVMLLYSRYRLHSRFHYQPIKNVDIFAAPLLWFETTDMDDIRKEFDYEGDSTKVFHSTIYEDAPEQNGFAVGSEVGFGVRLPMNLGVFAEGVFERSFSGKNVFAATLGFGYDICGISAFFKRNTYSLWFTFEVSLRHYVGEKWDGTGQSSILSLNLAL